MGAGAKGQNTGMRTRGTEACKRQSRRDQVSRDRGQGSPLRAAPFTSPTLSPFFLSAGTPAFEAYFPAQDSAVSLLWPPEGRLFSWIFRM